MSEKQPVCGHCNKNKAACFGNYGEEKNSYACDRCCGHGNEDGYCVKLCSSVSDSTLVN